MLRRTTATSAAFGVLAIFLLLLSVSQGVPVAVEEEEAESTVLPEVIAAVIELVEPSVKVEDLPFADSIRNPCPTNPPAVSRGSSVSEKRRTEFAVEFYKTVRDTSRRYQQENQEMLNDDVIHDCASQNVQNLQNTPVLTVLQTLNESDALESLYASILRHTAHAYFVRHQQNTYSNISCSSMIDNEARVSQKFGEIAVKQKYLACIFQMGATAMGYAYNYTGVTQQVLDETLSNLPLCSRRALRDCQVLKSTINLLGVVNDYAAAQSHNR